MVKLLYVTYLIALTTCLISAYKQECAVGPEYWCQSFQNAQDCGALRHCTDTVWRYDEKHTKVDSSTKCEWCQKILENTHKAIQNVANNEDLIKSTLINGCKLLPLEDISSKCTSTIDSYQTTVLSLMKHQRYDTLCHLMNICPSETIKTQVDDESKMLCHVIVHATHELHVNQHKTRNDIEIFLRNDCQQLSSSQLIEKCQSLVDRHGRDIYGHVASNIELSKVCDYIDDFADHSAVQTLPDVHCELCTFVLSTAKYMLDAKHTDDKVLLYIDEQICSRLTGTAKKSCKKMVDTNGRDLIKDIQQGTQPMLLCTHFHVCLDKITDETSPIEKGEMRSFLLDNLCDKLGSFKSACHALIEKDGTRLLQVLANEIDGDELCHMFGLCPKKSPLLDESAVGDDPNQCKRCVKDFTRRKHIAERLVNHSSEFIHHLCGQLPNKDDCIKAADESFNELLTFIRSLDPKSICIQLNMCDNKSLENLKAIDIIPSDNVIHEEILEYIKNDICNKLGSLSSLCVELVNSEGLSLLKLIQRNIDPHRVCAIVDVCPTNQVFENCEDKCQCCTNKVEIYQRQLAKFMKTIVASTRIMCDHMPARDMCLQMSDLFESNVNKVVARFDSKRLCQLLNLCTLSEDKSNDNQCQTCKTELNIRQNRFRITMNEVTTSLLSLCSDEHCRSHVRSTQQETLNQIEKINSQTLCQQLGYCTSEESFEPSSILLRLRSLAHHQTKTLDQRIDSKNLCSEYGQLKPICEHLMASEYNRRYAHVYMALLKNDPKLIDDDLREQMASKVHIDVCDGCKNAVQSSKDFWINALKSVRNALLRTCERCSAKDQCRDYYNQRFDNLKSYLNTIDPDQFCKSIHLCSSSLIVIQTDKCSTCIERLQSRKDGVLRAVSRVSSYFDDLCQRFGGKQCQIFVKQIEDSVEESIKNFDPKQTCILIGFCSTTVDDKAELDFDKYEKYLIDELDKNICSTLGPFETLCKQVIRGNTKQILTVKINYNIKDLMQIGEQLNHRSTNKFFNAENLDKCSNDKCQCCIDRVDAKKECAKNLGDKVIAVFTRSCDYCPAKDQCRQYWKDSQSQLDSYINDIDSKQVCTRFGFCNASALCANMGVFQQSCEDALSAFTDSFEHDPQTLERHLPHTSVVVLPTKSEEEETNVLNDSNSTCILCEYVMNILSTYIHQKSTEDEIEKSLEKVCNQMPATLQKQCHELIDNYGPPIIATLIREFDVATICRKLNLCTSQMKINPSNLAKANTASCSMCDYVSTYVDSALKRDSSEKSLQQALSTVCKQLSNEQSSQCETLVQLFAPHIRQLQLSSGGSNFCKELTICQTPMSELKPAIHLHRVSSKTEQPIDELKHVILKNLDDAPQCMLCHYVVSYLDAILKNNKSEAAVEAALERVCTILPRKDRLQCTEFVKSYGPVLAELISEMADPDAICRYLGVCQAVSSHEIPITYSNHHYARIPVK